MATPNKMRFLIGNGEKLTEDAKYITGPKPSKAAAYSMDEAIHRLSPKLRNTLRSISALPSSACPKREAVALVTLHPEFLAKSHFPVRLFAGVGIRAIGSRARTIKPEKWTANHKVKQAEAETIELYVAGPLQSFAEWSHALENGEEFLRGAEDLPRLEDIRPIEALDSSGRIRIPKDSGDKIILEAAIHVPEDGGNEILDCFKHYATSVGAKILQDIGLVFPGLAFAPVVVPKSSVARLAQFTFLRTLRPVVRLRGLPASNILRSSAAQFTPPMQLPFNPAIRIAILDGGIPEGHGLPNVKLYNAPGVGNANSAYLDHGTAVTGAFLWGNLQNGANISYASVDHFRILDIDDQYQNDLHAYKILKRIKDVVETGSHDIFNLSLGPDLSVDDDEVHPWTSAIDELASDGSRLIVAAAGNNGSMPSPLCRVQVPSDGVNCLCVGAADSNSDDWSRAPYSAKGPGRRPGVTKPDIVAFGGCVEEQFKVIRKRGINHTIESEMGTSFAAPLVTRAASALRSLFSSNLQPLTLKCMLIHTASRDGNPEEDVGWGRIAPEEALPLCPDNTARIVYQGDLPPKKVLRAKIPIPKGLTGRIEISATICYATEVRASDPLNYTNSGVEVSYRPNNTIHSINKDTKKPSTYAKTAPFFKKGNYADEGEQRTRDRKWETVLHATKRVDASKLIEPVFDLHFIPRLGALDHANPERIKYAMIISVKAPKEPDLYEKVLAEFPALQALTPVQVHASV